jgi:pteridine reductase
MATVIISGSGKRIGKGLAIEFAKKGWDVIIHYNQSSDSAQITANEIKNLGRKVTTFKADVRDYSAMELGFKNAVNTLEYPKVLVNNAAIYPKANNLLDTELSLWDEVLDTNLKSYFQLAKIFAENAQIDSRIINIASIGAFEIWKGRIPYNVSKAGVIQLTKALARDLAPKISVNSVSPGSILLEHEPPSEDLALKIESIPMKRYGTIYDIFDAVYFFATASSYITGQNINVDGGHHL